VAQDISATSLATTAIANSNAPAYQVEVQWNGTDWTDETDNLKRLTWNLAFAPPAMSVIQPGVGYANEAQMTLHNDDGRYSPYNSDSAIAAHIDAGAYYLTSVRAYAGFGGEQVRVFTGYIVQIQGLAASGEALFRLRDRSATIIQEKATTAMYSDIRTDEWLKELCGLVGIVTSGPSSEIVFDVGTLTLPFAWLDDESIWEQMALVAAAEGGFLYFDWQGKLHFENGAHWAQHDTSVFTFDRSTYADMEPEHRPDEVYNQVICEYSPRVEGPIQEVYSLDKPIVIQPGATYHLEARLNYPATAIYTPTAGQDWQAMLLTGEASNGSLSLANAVKWAQRYEVDLVNGDSNHALVVTKFRLMANPLLGDPAGEVTATGASSFVSETRTKEIRNNPLIQTASHAAALADFVVDRFQNPRHLYKITGALALPWLEMGDRVTIEEPTLFQGTYTNRTGFVTRLDFQMAPDQPFTMAVDAIGTAGMLQTNDYFILGTHKWGTGAGSGYLWYGGPAEAQWTDLTYTDLADGNTLAASYLNTLAANFNYLHGLLMAPVPAVCWFFGSHQSPFIYKGMIWHQRRYLHWSVVVGSGTVTIKVDGNTVATPSSTSAAYTDLNSLGLTVGEMYEVTVETTGSECYIVELAETADSSGSPTEPTFPTFSDGVVSDSDDLDSIVTGLNWIYARARNPVVPHISRMDSNSPSSWTEDDFPDDYRRVWRGTVRHRHNTLAYKLAYYLAYYTNNGKVQVRIRVDGASAGQYYTTKTAGTVSSGYEETGTIGSLTGLSAMQLTKVEVWARHELATVTTEEPIPDSNPPSTRTVVTQRGDDNSSFGPVYLYETASNGAIAGWAALPDYDHQDQPTAANLNKFKADGDLLAPVARYANRPTPKLDDGTLRVHGVQVRHTWRFLKYQTHYRSVDGEDNEAQSVKLSYGDNDLTLEDTTEGGWNTYDLDQIKWLPPGALYKIDNAVYAIEVYTA